MNSSSSYMKNKQFSVYPVPEWSTNNTRLLSSDLERSQQGEPYLEEFLGL